MKKLLILTLAPLLSMTLSAQEAAPSGGSLTALQQADRQFLATIDPSASAAPALEAPVAPASAPTTVPAFRQRALEPVESVRPKTVRQQPAKKPTTKTTRTTRVEKPREIAPQAIPRAIPVMRVAAAVEPRTVFRISAKPRVTFSAAPWITVKTTTVTTRSHRVDDDDDEDDEDEDDD